MMVARHGWLLLALSLASGSVAAASVRPHAFGSTPQTLTLGSGEMDLLVSFLDATHQNAYFATGGPVTSPVLVRIRLSDFSRDGSLVLNANSHAPCTAAVDEQGGIAYVGLYGPPAAVVKVDLATLTTLATLTLGAGDVAACGAVIDPGAGNLYVGVNGAPTRIERIRLSDFSRTGALDLEPQEGYLGPAAIDAGAGAAYFATNSTPPEILQIRLADFTRQASALLQPGDKIPSSLALDATTGDLYVGLAMSPAQVVKVGIAGLSVKARLVFPAGNNSVDAALLDTVNGIGYFGTAAGYLGFAGTGTIHKVRLSDLTSLAAVSLGPGETGIGTGLLDGAGGYAYFGTLTNPGLVARVDLGNTTLALAPSVASPRVGESLTLRATVSPVAAGGGTPSGSVEFALDGAAPEPRVGLSGGGATSAPLSFSTAGAHQLSATYDSGGAAFNPSATTRPLVVLRGDTAVTVTAVAGPRGEVVATAFVTATPPASGQPTGAVRIFDATDGTRCTAPVSAGVAVCSLYALQVGSHGLRAEYAGDANFAAGAGIGSVLVADAAADIPMLPAAALAALAAALAAAGIGLIRTSAR